MTYLLCLCFPPQPRHMVPHLTNLWKLLIGNLVPFSSFYFSSTLVRRPIHISQTCGCCGLVIYYLFFSFKFHLRPQQNCCQFVFADKFWRMSMLDVRCVFFVLLGVLPFLRVIMLSFTELVFDAVSLSVTHKFNFNISGSCRTFPCSLLCLVTTQITLPSEKLMLWVVMLCWIMLWLTSPVEDHVS